MAERESFSEEPSQIEIVRWAIAALVCGGLAVFGANVGRFVPSQVINLVHTTHHQGASMDQLRAQVANLRQLNGTMAADYRSLMNRFNLLDDDSGEVIRRLAAVENSLPLLIESLPVSTDIDRSLLTASIAEAGGEVYVVEGGEMVIRHSPLFDGLVGEALPDQPLPPVLEPIAIDERRALAETSLLGIAVGPDIEEDRLAAIYDEIVDAAGPLLLGTVPLLGRAEDGARSRIVLGPLPDGGSVEMLCDRLYRIGIACERANYVGQAWPL